VAKVYIVSFRSKDDRKPSKFIVVANDRKHAIKWLGSMEGRVFRHGSINPHNAVFIFGAWYGDK